MKKFLFPLIGVLAIGLLINWSCSNSNTSPTNFQGPVTTIVGSNPSFTFTPTPSFTPTPTFTATFTFTPTSTPYAVSTWSGFNNPSAIAVDTNGKVYVADTGNNFVERYNPNGVLDISWGAGGLKGKVAYTTPKGIAVDSNGNLFVVGNGNQVSKYSPIAPGASVTLISNSFSGATLSGPRGIATNAAGTTIAVADTGDNWVPILNNSGVSVTGYGVTAPAGVAVDGNGNIFASTGNTVVELYSSPLTIPGFSSPQGLAVDSSNNLWVADKGNKQIEDFAGTGLNLPPLVLFNGSNGLNGPAGVAVDASDNIYVVDSTAGTVVKFAP